MTGSYRHRAGLVPKAAHTYIYKWVSLHHDLLAVQWKCDFLKCLSILADLKQHESPAVKEQYVISLQKVTNQKP